MAGKLKPAGKAVIVLLIMGLGVGAYFGLKAFGVFGGDSDVTTAAAPGVTKEVPVQTASGETKIVKKQVYTVALSQWPGHMAGIIACEGLTTQPGSFCSTVTSSKPGDEAGIQLKFVFLETPDEKNGALQQGKVDFTWQVVDEMPLNMPGYTNAKVPVQAFVQIDWSRGGDACVASSAVRKVEDIYGRKSAMMKYSPDHTVFEYMITNSGLSPQQVAQVRNDTSFSMDSWEYGRELFVQGKVDVACLWEPDVTLALKRPGSHRLFSTADATTLVADVLLARTSLLEQHPEIAEKVARVFIEGAKIGNANKTKAARLISTVVPRFRDELKFEGTKQAVNWVRWNELGDNVAFFGVDGSKPKFDGVYKQADGIWGEYNDNGKPTLTARFSPQGLRTPAIIKRIYDQEQSQLAAAGKPTVIAPEKIQYNPVVARTGQAKLTKPVSIHFNTGQSSLDANARSILRTQVLPQLALAEGMYVRIEGNTDDVGPDNANRILSDKRAASVRAYLVSQGIPTARVASVGNGESNPVCNLKTADCRAQNRRTDVKLVSQR